MKKLMLLVCIVSLLPACAMMARTNPWTHAADKNQSATPLYIKTNYLYVDTSGSNYNEEKSELLGVNALKALQKSFAEKGYPLKLNSYNQQQQEVIEDRRKYLLANLVAKENLERFWENVYGTRVGLPMFKKYPVHQYNIGTQLASLDTQNSRYGIYFYIRNVERSAGFIASGMMRSFTNVVTLGISESLNEFGGDSADDSYDFMVLSVVDIKSGDVVFSEVDYSDFDYQNIDQIADRITSMLKKSPFNK